MVSDEVIDSRADHHRHMAGTEKAIEMKIGRIEDRLDRRDDGDVIAEEREVRQALRFCCSTVKAVEGMVVSKPRPKKTTSRSRLARARAKASSGE